jgi:hypothetical protein
MQSGEENKEAYRDIGHEMGVELLNHLGEIP